MERDDKDMHQRQQHAGNYVAWLDGKVILSAETDTELYDRLGELPREVEARAIVEFVRRTDIAYVPWFGIVGSPPDAP